MELQLDRFSHALDYTYGILGEQCYTIPFGFTLEDQAQLNKVAGETRIESRRYQIKQRKVLSGLTKNYRKRFPWFTWHLELIGVPGFKYVYIHIGNDDDDTEACILMAYTCDLNANENGFIGKSTPCFKAFYQKITAALESGEEVWITIQDINP